MFDFIIMGGTYTFKKGEKMLSGHAVMAVG